MPILLKRGGSRNRMKHNQSRRKSKWGGSKQDRRKKLKELLGSLIFLAANNNRVLFVGVVQMNWARVYEPRV